MAPLTFAFSPANPAARTGRTHAARPRAATLALVAGALATALATLASPPVWAQPAAPVAPASVSAPADAAPAPTAPERQRQRMQQQQQQQSPQMRQQRMQQRQEQRQEQRMERRQQYRAERMAAFKAQLQLTPAQESAWSDFTATALQPGPRHARLDAEGMAGLSTPERIDRMRALRIQRAADADRRGEAVKAFYATLSAPQQHTFDTHMQHMQQRMGGKGRYGGPDTGQARGNGYGNGNGYGYGKGMGKAGGMDCDQPGQWRTPQPAAPAPLTPQ